MLIPISKKDCIRRTLAMGEFSDCMEGMELVDLQLDVELTLSLKDKTILIPLE